MKLSISIHSAITTLKKNRTRSTLTSIGIVIGVASVIMMVGFGYSAKIVVRQKVFSFGENAVVVQGSPKEFITAKDSKYLRDNFYEIKYASLNTTEKNIRISKGSKVASTLLNAVENDFFQIQGWKLKYGSYFSREQMDNLENVVIVGDTIRKNFIGFTDPVGQEIIIDGKPFRIIGSLEPRGLTFTQTDFDDFVAMPYMTFHSRIKNEKIRTELFVGAVDEQSLGKAINILKSYFRQKYNQTADEKDDFVILTNDENLEIAEYISLTLSSLLIGIASISLIVGGIGIMNIMLVSVSERTREIGIRMAIGARNRDILMQFIIESVTLCVLGGITGILLGYLIYFIIILMLGWQFYFSLLSIIISFSFACFVGIFFGYYPAKKAAKLNPIDALRYE
ncbi:MAG: ABC transporter permease [Spirochaetes bacterium]|nr:ABC transporter permease [Spirochaetota bacterium]